MKERPALKAEADVAKIHRLFAAMRNGDDLYAVKLTVKQFRSGGAALSVDGVEKLYKLYDAKLEKRMPAPAAWKGSRPRALRLLRTQKPLPLGAPR